MNQDVLACQVETTINASAARVWQTLTDPKLIKQYMYDADTISDWKVGSPIVFRGEYNGGTYEEKGIITELIPNQRLSYTDLSTGMEDKPENYLLVTYNLGPVDTGIKLVVTQSNMKDADMRDRAQTLWRETIAKIKEVAELRQP